MDIASQIRNALTHRHFQIAIDLTSKRFGYRRVVYSADPEIGEGRISSVALIEIGKAALYFGYDPITGTKGTLSPSWLASSVYNELIHWDQRFGSPYRWGRDTTQGGHGVTPTERVELQRRYDKELKFLRPPHDTAVRKGDFSVPEIYQVPR